MPRWPGRSLVPLVCALCVAAAAAQQPAPQQATPAFRSGTTLISVEVRVVDRNRRPVEGLQASDFTIIEDGKTQDVRHFVPITLTPQAEGVTDEPLIQRSGTRPFDTPSTRRVFLILLGRGDLQIPAKGLDGMIHLVRNLLPQDLVAVMAWNRATPFTSNHAQIAAVLERYKAGYRPIERLLLDHFSGLRAIYGTRDMPDFVQREIDKLFQGTVGAPVATLVPEQANPLRQVEQGVRRETDLLLTKAPALDLFAAGEAANLGMSLDDYVSNRVASLQDLHRIYAGLGYLRYIDGEKHLVYISPRGLGLPSADDDRSLARVAQDARVVLDVFHTDGMSADIWAVASSQNIAELTGGQYTGVNFGVKFADWVNAASRTAYQLGYYSTRPDLDGKYRKIQVKVNRRDVTPLYRRGYYARDTAVVIDRAEVIAQSRMSSALRYAGNVPDVRLTASAVAGKAKDGTREMVVQVNVAPAAVKFNRLIAEHAASLDLAVLCADERRLLVGHKWQRVDLRLSETQYEQYLKSGLGFTVHVPIRRSARHVKVAVYDRAADLVGTLETKPK